jgi:hypothetical protein
MPQMLSRRRINGRIYDNRSLTPLAIHKTRRKHFWQTALQVEIELFRSPYKQ